MRNPCALLVAVPQSMSLPAGSDTHRPLRDGPSAPGRVTSYNACATRSSEDKVPCAWALLLAWPRCLTDNLIEMSLSTSQMRAWTLPVMSVLGVAFLVVGLILGLGEGQRPTVGAILVATTAAVGTQ